MDHREPSPVTPAPEIPAPPMPAEKKGWSLLDLFKSKENDTPKPNKPLKAEALHGERTIKAPAPGRFGEAILRLLGGERSQVAPPAPEVSAAEQESIPAAPEQAPERPLTIIERAKDMGRNVLRLLKGVRTEVQAADEREAVLEPTDLQPLEEADEQVRAAVQELVAPIEEHQANNASGEAVPETAPPVVPGPSAPDIAGSQRPEPAFATVLRAAEMAMAVAVASRTERLERPQRSGVMRKLGVLALGGALVYTWHRQRQIKKEQKRQHRELQRFEAEVRQEQQAAADRIQILERTNIEQLDQQKRQAHVREVSRFALGQAEEIHQVAVFARSHERAEEPAPATPSLPPLSPQAATPERPAPIPPVRREFEPMFEAPALPAPPAERSTPERPPLLPTRKEAETTPERRTIMERLTNAVTGQSPPSADGAPGATGANLGSRLRDIVSGTPQSVDPTAQPQSATPQPPRPQPAQAWLLGAALAAGIGGFLLLIALGIL